MNLNKEKKAINMRQLLSILGAVFAVFGLIAVLSSFASSGKVEDNSSSEYVKPILQDKYVEYDTDYTVTFVVNSTVYAGCGVNRGQAVLEPAVPTSEGLYFGGWYTSEQDGSEITFPFTPTSDTVLYASFTDKVVLGFTGLTDEVEGVVWTDIIRNKSLYTTSRKGDYVTVTSSLDDYFPFNQIEEFTDENGNVFVKFPKCYIKFITVGDSGSKAIDGFKVANYQAEDDMFIPDCFLDPKDETCSTYLDYFALAKYESSGSAAMAYSKSGKDCLSGITLNQHRDAARAYGTADNYYNGYQVEDFSMYSLYNMLCMLYFKTGDIQSVYEGRTGAIKGTTWVSTAVTGTTDGVEGLNGWNTETHCVKMLGVENPYGNTEKFIDGVFTLATHRDGEVLPLLYVYKLPQYHNSLSASYDKAVPVYILANESGIIKNLKVGNMSTEAGDSYVVIAYPCSFSLGEDSEINDYYNYVSTDLDVKMNITSSGNYSSGTNAGLWYWNSVQDTVSLDAGSRLAYRPVN